MSGQIKTYVTPEEYLAFERKSESKHEYFDGEIFAMTDASRALNLMTGASRKHNLIVSNVNAELRNQLKRKPCEVYPSDMRVKVSATGLYTYPDVVVACGEPKFEDAFVDTLLNPTLIVEVLSESTESHDRGKKFGHYRAVESLAEYVLVAQDEYRIEQYVKQADGRWLLSDTHALEGTVELASVGCLLALAEVYDKVVFD